jgi:hypothetical protein
MQTCPNCEGNNTSHKRTIDPETDKDAGGYDECHDCGHIFNANVELA